MKIESLRGSMKGESSYATPIPIGGACAFLSMGA